MGTVAKTYTFANGNVADGTHVNANFDTLYTLVNGNISSANLADDAVTHEKLAADAVESEEIKNGEVTAEKLASDLNTKALTGAAAYALTDGAAVDINWNNGSTQRITLGGNRTFNTPTYPVNGQVYRLILLQDGTGSRTMTWWATSIKWAGGTAPTLTTTASKADIVTLLYASPDGGTNYYYYASIVLNF